MSGEDRKDRLIRLFVLEITRIMRHFSERREFLVHAWSRYRAREPFAETLFHRYRTVAATDLLLLDLAHLDGVEAFYEAVDEIAMYFRYTEDMPVTLGDRYEEEAERLREVGVQALLALGVDLESLPEAADATPGLLDPS